MDKYRRRHYFIDRSYQGGVVARIVMICSAGMLLELGLFNYLSYGNIESMRWKTHIGIERISEIVSFYLVYSSLFSIFVTVGVLYLFLSSVLKKTAGPIYRLNKDIGSAADGNLSLSIWLRGEDDFKETAAELDRMNSSVAPCRPTVGRKRLKNASA